MLFNFQVVDIVFALPDLSPQIRIEMNMTCGRPVIVSYGPPLISNLLLFTRFGNKSVKITVYTTIFSFELYLCIQSHKCSIKSL